jgi:predicted Zn-dependent protease
MPISDTLPARFRALAPRADHVSLRMVEETTEVVSVRRDVAEPPQRLEDRGVMVTVCIGDGVGYAATSDLSDSGLRAALSSAGDWARLSAGRSVFDGNPPRFPTPRGRHAGATATRSFGTRSERLELLLAESRECPIDPRIVDWTASLSTTSVRQLFVTADGEGEATQEHRFTVPALTVTAFAGGLAQTRSFGGRGNGFCQKGGLDVLSRAGFEGAGRRTAEEALVLVGAPNCPTGKLDVVLMPDQMLLQIHESVGHPIELDRILGDERNYAGTSFVTLDMFGSYRYGSELLDVTFDPTQDEQFASFGIDDDGAAASKEYLIRRGILERPLGGTVSQGRAGLSGVATARASGWNRPPIDRMSNLNVEPGTSSLEDLIAGVEDGVLLRTNVSWSIDDSRNKFQFGCEWGERIRRGRRVGVVRNPNYRGISATFWRSLTGVGDASTVEVLGTPFCGKGEPNQIIRVGHASPPCRFAGVDVFGAEQ